MSTFPSTSSSPPTTLPGDTFSTSSDPITLPGSVASSGALSSTSHSSSVTDSSSSSPSSFSSTSTSSGSVLQQQTTTSITTTVPVPRTTLFTTVVKTSMTVNSGRTSTRTTTEVVPTGTLMPDTSGAGNIFARDKGALAGLILGCIALAGLIVAWALFAYRRHRVRSAQNADAVAALRSGPGRTRAVMLDEEDDEDGHAADMAFLGAGPVSRTSGGVRYARLRGGNHLEGAAEDGSGTRRQDVSGGAAVGFASASIPRGLDEEMEDAVLMHPSNRDFDVTPAGVSNGSSLGSQDRASAGNSSPGAGLGPVKSLGGQVASPDPTTAGYFDGAVHDNLSERPASPSSVYSDEVMSGHSIVGAMGAYIGGEQLAYGRDNYVSSSTQGHGATESSFGGHGSSNDDKIGGSSSGDVPSSTTHSSQLMLPRPVPASAPSSLLPTKKAPPTAFCDLGDIESASRDADQRRKSGFLERSLRSLRLRSPRTELATRTSAHDPSATPHASIAHLQPQTLDSVLFRSELAIPEGAAPARMPGLGPLSLGLHARTVSGAPVWPGLGSTAGRPDAPSPAPTEGSTRTPDGLLNPKWLNGDGMRSQGVISFRDDMDYSRPIGGWVNNRQRSCTTLNTVSPTGSQCHHSLESQQTDGLHMHTQPVPIPHDEEHSTPLRYEELSRPPPLIEITSPPASSR
ncbi:hypothetical protein LXA43DRAFT_1088474 [Ganoderma leucocontextum]|nr:hypothetical protein LXA43DRAFT_1088474 [Ganoderma leucocontextum]